MSRRIRSLPAVLPLLALLGPLAAAQPVCERSTSGAPALERLTRVMAQGRFVAYEPSALKVYDGRVQAADPASIRADLAALRPRFDGLITYDSIHGAEAIPQLAAQLKFHALVIGVWNPANAAELDAALGAAR